MARLKQYHCPLGTDDSGEKHIWRMLLADNEQGNVFETVVLERSATCEARAKNACDGLRALPEWRCFTLAPKRYCRHASTNLEPSWAHWPKGAMTARHISCKSRYPFNTSPRGEAGENTLGNGAVSKDARSNATSAFRLCAESRLRSNVARRHLRPQAMRLEARAGRASFGGNAASNRWSRAGAIVECTPRSCPGAHAATTSVAEGVEDARISPSCPNRQPTSATSASWRPGWRTQRRTHTRCKQQWPSSM